MSEQEIIINDNGSIRVNGKNIKIKDVEGKEYDLGGRESISLCRCGHSANKPFCDGNHRTKGFSSMERARSLPPPKNK